TEGQVTDLNDQPAMGRVDEVDPYPGIACLRGSNGLEFASVVSPFFNPTAISRQEGRLVIRSTKDLQLHRALTELGWTGVIDELNDAARLKNQSVPDPILITTNGTILAGFGRWRSAVFEGKNEIKCIEYPLSEDESLQFIIRHHQPERGWNAFTRIRLALKLEPYLQQKALENMRAREERAINKVSRQSMTRPKKSTIRPEPVTVSGASRQTEAPRPGSVTVRVSRLQRTVVVIGRRVLTALQSQEKLKRT